MTLPIGGAVGPIAIGPLAGIPAAVPLGPLAGAGTVAVGPLAAGPLAEAPVEVTPVAVGPFAAAPAMDVGPIALPRAGVGAVLDNASINFLLVGSLLTLIYVGFGTLFRRLSGRGPALEQDGIIGL
jgi:hypothetical protein